MLTTSHPMYGLMNISSSQSMACTLQKVLDWKLLVLISCAGWDMPAHGGRSQHNRLGSSCKLRAKSEGAGVQDAQQEDLLQEGGV